MKRLSTLLLIGLFLTSTVYASVGVKAKTASSQSMTYQATDINMGGSTVASDGSTVSVGGVMTYPTTLINNSSNGVSTALFSSSTTLQQANCPYAVVYKSIGNVASETTTLPTATPGQVTTFFVYHGSTSGTWIIKPDTAATTPVASTGWTSITFSLAGQGATLLYLDDTRGWIILSTYSSASVVLPTIAYPTVN